MSRRAPAGRPATEQSGELTAAEAFTRAGWDQASQGERGLLLDIFGLSQAPEKTSAQSRLRPETPARVIVAPRLTPGVRYQILPEIAMLVGRLEAAWAAWPQAAAQAAAALAEPEAGP